LHCQAHRGPSGRSSDSPSHWQSEHEHRMRVFGYRSGPPCSRPWQPAFHVISGRNKQNYAARLSYDDEEPPTSGLSDHVVPALAADSAGNGPHPFPMPECFLAPMIVGQEASDSASEMSLREDDVVSRHSRAGPDHSLNVRRLPGTAWCGDNFSIRGLHLVLNVNP